ncbi:MAG: AAA family ATPase, partial [Gammaproteobacteria bacterium]
MPLRLRSITAEAFKSIRQLSLDIRHLTVFLGANAVGKSNIFDAFRFLKDRVEQGLDAAVQKRGGLEYCSWRGST